MHSESSIIIYSTIDNIFETAADLSLWPKILPHYRYINFLEKKSTKFKVEMAAKRNWIPIKWTSDVTIFPDKKEIHFQHLKAFTKGMKVVWTFTQLDSGVDVRIFHDLKSKIPIIGKFIAEQIVGNFFIHYVANQTLTHMKQYIEKKYGS
jgi:ribosome-associated toxin RatA of RatAB toxin-antitoxin module